MGKDIRMFMTMFGIIIGEAGIEENGRLRLIRPLKFQVAREDVLFNRVVADEREVIIPLGASIEVVLEQPLKEAYNEAALQAFTGLVLAR